MANITIKTPAVVKISNESDKVISFVPYRENFVTHIDKDFAVEFTAETAGQVLYYLKQATNGLTVSQLADFDAPNDKLLVIKTPAKITITNNSSRIMSFVPYKENFIQDVLPGEKVELTAKTFGQVLYYLAQTNDGLDIEQAPAENAGNGDNE